MRNVEIYFDGFCPESLLKGKFVEMKLNQDDFWESEATGLQIALFPPYATILKWRGKGQLISSLNVASDTISGLVMAEGLMEKGREMFPDESSLICNKDELQACINVLSTSKEEYDKARFNPNDRLFEVQNQYLETISQDQLMRVTEMFNDIEFGDGIFSYDKDLCRELNRTLHNEVKLIFSFNWMEWKEGWQTIEDFGHDYSNCSLLDISMYITAVFRAERFSDSTLDNLWKNGVLNKIFDRLRMIALEKKQASA